MVILRSLKMSPLQLALEADVKLCQNISRPSDRSFWGLKHLSDGHKIYQGLEMSIKDWEFQSKSNT